MLKSPIKLKPLRIEYYKLNTVYTVYLGHIGEDGEGSGCHVGFSVPELPLPCHTLYSAPTFEVLECRLMYTRVKLTEPTLI